MSRCPTCMKFSDEPHAHWCTAQYAPDPAKAVRAAVLDCARALGVRVRA